MLRVILEGCAFNNQGQFKVRYSRRGEILALVGFLVLCLAVGLSGSGVCFMALRAWYPALHAPPGRPPIWVFLAVWPFLYVMLGLAAWAIWRVPDVAMNSHRALNAWGCQLGVKALWTPIFFGLHWLLPSFGVGVLLLGVVGWTIWRFAKLNMTAALLMAPYFCWLGFEVYLNAGFWWLNR
jgi:tryptophan-rich sensory protein